MIHTKFGRILLVAFTILGWLSGAIVARADEDGQQLFRDLQDQRLDQFSMLEASLLVGGWDYARSSAVARRWTQEADFCSTNESTLSRIHRIMDFIHAHVMIGQYDESASQVTSTVSTGNYNCVSAGTLFLGLAEINQLSARGVLLPGHMRCRVWIPEQMHWIDVEPTRSSEYLVPQTNHDKGRELSATQVLAKLYYNRGIELLSERDYWAALRCATYGTQLDPLHQAGRDNVTAVINNWSLTLCEQHRFEDAVYLLRQGRRQAPQDPLLAANEIHVYVVWMQHLLHEGDPQAAEDRLTQALSQHPTSEILRKLSTTLGAM